MAAQLMGQQSLWGLVLNCGWTLYPLIFCSLIVWGVIFERLWSYRRLGHHLRAFHLEAMNTLLRSDLEALRNLCRKNDDLPTSRLLTVALERIHAKDQRLKENWSAALERSRQLINQELRQYLWILGTVGSAAPFIGLFGTVVGILQSFQEMARNGVGGFTVVAAGISEALVTTAAGIIVAVLAVMAFNAFQIRWNQIVLTIRIHIEELAEILAIVTSEPALQAAPISGKEGASHGS